jgi:hypothetical protein
MKISRSVEIFFSLAIIGAFCVSGFGQTLPDGTKRKSKQLRPSVVVFD